MFKERLKGVIIGIVATAIITSSIPAFAKATTEAVTISYNNIKIVLNGRILSTENEPFVLNGRAYLPVRDIADALGLGVEWDGNTQTAYLGDIPANIGQSQTQGNQTQTNTGQNQGSQPQPANSTPNYANLTADERYFVDLCKPINEKFKKDDNFALNGHTRDEFWTALKIHGSAERALEEFWDKSRDEIINTHFNRKQAEYNLYFQSWYFNSFLKYGDPYYPFYKVKPSDDTSLLNKMTVVGTYLPENNIHVGYERLHGATLYDNFYIPPYVVLKAPNGDIYMSGHLMSAYADDMTAYNSNQHHTSQIKKEDVSKDVKKDITGISEPTLSISNNGSKVTVSWMVGNTSDTIGTNKGEAQTTDSSYTAYLNIASTHLYNVKAIRQAVSTAEFVKAKTLPEPTGP